MSKVSRVQYHLLSLLALVLFLAAQTATAQNNPENQPEATEARPAQPPSLDSPDDDDIFQVKTQAAAPSPYNFGDQTFNISLSLALPIGFYRQDGQALDNKVFPGGAGTLSYNYFLSENLAVGGEFSGMFASTLGSNLLYMLPFGFRISWQFTTGSLEFPLSLMVGAASQSYINSNYFGLFVKPAAAAYWRFDPEWSLGIDLAWWWIPQWTGDDKTCYGNFLGVSLSTRYHF